MTQPAIPPLDDQPPAEPASEQVDDPEDLLEPPPAQPVLVAETRGDLVAAVSLLDGVSVSDPFRPTADVVELLRMRAARLKSIPSSETWRQKTKSARC